MKIIIITNIPSPYRIPLLNRIHNEFLRKRWELRVIFLARGYARRKWNVNENEFEFEYEYLKDPYITLGEGFTSFSLSLFAKLIRQKPDMIIVAGFTFPTIWVYLFSRMFDVPYFVWSGETLTQSQIRYDRFALRILLRKFLARSASGGVAYGSEAKSYLRNLGINSNMIFTAINTVDTSYFRKSAMAYRADKKTLKAKMKLPDINILYVGHLTKLKGLQCFFRAYSQVVNVHRNVGIHIVGDGEYKEELIGLSRELKLQNVYFWGFKQKDELPLYYGICDIFVFPSFYDVWGLVCIEAMSSGLPVISSNHAGVTEDLVIDHFNGFRVEPTEFDDFSHKLELLIKDDKLREQLSHNASETIENHFLVSHSSKGFENAANSVLVRRE